MRSKSVANRVGIRREFEAVDLGDKRLDARLVGVATRIAAAPSESFPKMVASEGEREGLYRFLSNPRVSWRDILGAHITATVGRARFGDAGGITRLVHDTTDFVFSGDRDGLGTVMKDTKGFFMHLCLAVSGDEARVPLGVMGLHPYVRKSPSRKKSLNEHKLEVRARPRDEKESHRWETLAFETAAHFGDHPVLHVMDQEADDFVLLSILASGGHRFVIRGSSKRQLDEGSVAMQLADEESRLFRWVLLSPRTKPVGHKQKRAHPRRDERIAELHVRWTQIELPKPVHAQTDVQMLPLYVVQVHEPAPPEGNEPIEWTLYTTERVTNLDEATAVVDHYRARWRIEEYFRAIKQGCAVQKRQLESFDAIVRAIAVFAPIAWQLLLLRSLAHVRSDLPSSRLFAADELDALAALLEDKGCKPMPKDPTVGDVLNAIATVGGHIRQNGPPGWLVLGRGFDDFLSAVRIWRAAKRGKKK